jgi:ABC-type sugar transport system ATPase subunit
MAQVELKNVSKIFNRSVKAVKDLNMVLRIKK